VSLATGDWKSFAWTFQISRPAVILEFNQHNMHQAFELSERARARAFLD
jgi:hypothetical protein